MRKLTYYVACTADGFIAHPDGSYEGFLNEGEHLADLRASFPETWPAHLRDGEMSRADNRCFDAVLMGRKTYEVGLNVGVTNPYPTLDQYVISRSMTTSPDKNVELVSEDPVQLVRKLKRDAGKDIWLCGGASLAAALFAEIDEIIVKRNPVLFGEGIPMFARAVEPTELELTEHKVYRNGFMLLYYRVKRAVS